MMDSIDIQCILCGNRHPFETGIWSRPGARRYACSHFGDPPVSLSEKSVLDVATRSALEKALGIQITWDRIPNALD